MLNLFSLSGGRLWSLLASLIGALAVLWWAYTSGYTNGTNAAQVECNRELRSRDDAQREAVNAAISKQIAMRGAAIERAREYWEANQQREQVVQTIEKEVIKYVEREKASADPVCVLDVDFVRIWNTANRSTTDQGSAND